MTRKLKPAEQMAIQLQHIKMQSAGYLRDKYPHVKEVHLDFTYEDPDNLVKPSKRGAYSLAPEHSALFEFKCAYWECVQGGFDLSSPLSAMLNNRQTEINGEAICQGWQDQERVGKFHCDGKLIYRITAKYASNE